MLHISKAKSFTVAFICLLSLYLSISSFFPSLLKGEHASYFSKHKINLGLDLQGGAYILLDVDMASYKKEQMNKVHDQLKSKLNALDIQYSSMEMKSDSISFACDNDVNAKKIAKSMLEYFGALLFVKLDGADVAISFEEQAYKMRENELMAQTIEIVRRRIDEDGTKEIDIQRQGDSYILVQVPGIEDPKQIKRLLGKTAKLAFHIVDDSVTAEDARNGRVPFGIKMLLLEGEKGEGKSYVPVQARAMLTGDMLENAQATVSENRPVVNFRFNTLGARLFGEATTANSGRMMAIVLDNKVISAPVIREPILGGNGVISGNFSIQSANELALLLRAGALPVPLKIAEERSVGPSLGLDSIKAGTKAAMIGTCLVVVFMFLFYGVFGIIANIALIFNLIILIAVLGLFGATLTMPGIAGIVLTLGMAVDSNVLIFERIREEVRNGRSIISSIESGYNLAFATIFDSNITTILAAVILIIFGTGPVKGFAITLSVGILCSMFTSVTLSKVLTAYWYRKFKPNKLPI